jgi:predicted nucleic acid-binding protein
MIVLDTNVLSEVLRARPDPAVLSWSLSFPPDMIAAAAVTEAEIRLGIARLPEGKRREALAVAADRLFVRMADRVLPFGRAAVPHYAAFMASRRAAGRPASLPDAMIAATALAAGATAIATRDTAGFEGCGLPLINPWRGA